MGTGEGPSGRGPFGGGEANTAGGGVSALGRGLGRADRCWIFGSAARGLVVGGFCFSRLPLGFLDGFGGLVVVVADLVVVV